MSSTQGKAGAFSGCRVRKWAAMLVLLILGAAIAPSATAQDALRDQRRRISKVPSWKMTFRYEMDVSFTNQFGGMSEEIIRFVESEGTVIFTRSPDKRRFAGQGTAEYRLEYYTLTSADNMFSDSSSSGDKYRMLNIEEGSGSTSIIKEVEMNVLEFDFGTHTYMFRIIPGEDLEYDFGVPTRSVMDMEIIDPLLDETSEEVAETVDRNQLKAMFPEHVVYEDFVSSFSVEVFGIPLPFFGLKLCGSYTDSQGGVVTWIIEPAATGAAGAEADGDLFETEVWTHYHPKEYSEQNIVTSAWEEVRRQSAGSGSGAGNDNSPQINVYLVQDHGTGTGIPISTGDELVAVDVTESHRNGLSGEAEPSGGFAGIIASALAEATATPEDSSRIQTALYALFYTNFADGPDDPRNTIQEYPLTLDAVQVEGNSVSVGILGAFDPRNQGDGERIKEQIKHTVTENSGQEMAVSILLNQKEF